MTDKSVIDTIIAEAGGSEAGMRAVAAVIANRAAQSGLTPAQVVKQAGQFEGYSNPGRGSREAQKVGRLRDMAERAFTDISTGKVADPTHGSTSFRTAGTKIHAPHGTVEIAGNVFAKGKAGSALDAINAAAPSPQSKPTALAYADNGSVTPPKLPHISGNLQGLSSAAMNGVGPLPGRVDLQPMTPGQAYSAGNSPLARPDISALLTGRVGTQVQPPAFRASATGGVSAGASGNGRSAIMPQLPRPRPSAPLTSRSVQTVHIGSDGNPISDLQFALDNYAANRADPSNPANAPKVAAVPKAPTPLTGSYVQGPIKPGQLRQKVSVPQSAPTLTASASGTGGFASGGNGSGSMSLPTRVASIPGPSGYTNANKDASQLQPTTALAFGSPVQQAPAVQAITHQIVNPAYTAWKASQTQPLHAGQAYTAGGSVVSQAAQNAFGGMAPNTNIAAVPLPRPRPAPPHYLTIHTPPGPQAIDPWSSARYGIPAVPRPGMVTAPAVQSRVAPHPGGLLGILGGLFNGGGAPPAPAAPQAPGYNGQTSVTSDQLAGANQGFGGTNALMPDSMNNSRWLTGY